MAIKCRKCGSQQEHTTSLPSNPFLPFFVYENYDLQPINVLLNANQQRILSEDSSRVAVWFSGSLASDVIAIDHATPQTWPGVPYVVNGVENFHISIWSHGPAVCMPFYAWIPNTMASTRIRGYALNLRRGR